MFVKSECDNVDVKEECVDEEDPLATGMDSASEGK